MKKLILMILVIGSLLNADYIPYKELKNYTFSIKSGWRGSAEGNYIILSMEQKKYPSVSISKKLYNELAQHNDYNGHFNIAEFTNLKTKAKSYEYNLLLPIEVLSSLAHQKGKYGMTYRIDLKGNKTCKGTSVIDNSGYIWCTANSLKDLLIEE